MHVAFFVFFKYQQNSLVPLLQPPNKYSYESRQSVQTIARLANPNHSLTETLGATSVRRMRAPLITSWLPLLPTGGLGFDDTNRKPVLPAPFPIPFIGCYPAGPTSGRSPPTLVPATTKKYTPLYTDGLSLQSVTFTHVFQEPALPIPDARLRWPALSSLHPLYLLYLA